MGLLCFLHSWGGCRPSNRTSIMHCRQLPVKGKTRLLSCLVFVPFVIRGPACGAHPTGSRRSRAGFKILRALLRSLRWRNPGFPPSGESQNGLYELVKEQPSVTCDKKQVTSKSEAAQRLTTLPCHLSLVAYPFFSCGFAASLAPRLLSIFSFSPRFFPGPAGTRDRRGLCRRSLRGS